MRNKEDILDQLSRSNDYLKEPQARLNYSLVAAVEILVDVRDVLRWLFEELRELNKKW